MNEKQAREEHLLYKATIGMDMSDGDYNKLFGKVKTEVQQCEYDSEFKCILVHNLAKTRLPWYSLLFVVAARNRKWTMR